MATFASTHPVIILILGVIIGIVFAAVSLFGPLVLIGYYVGDEI